MSSQLSKNVVDRNARNAVHKHDLQPNRITKPHEGRVRKALPQCERTRTEFHKQAGGLYDKVKRVTHEKVKVGRSDFAKWGSAYESLSNDESGKENATPNKLPKPWRNGMCSLQKRRTEPASGSEAGSAFGALPTPSCTGAYYFDSPAPGSQRLTLNNQRLAPDFQRKINAPSLYGRMSLVSGSASNVSSSSYYNPQTGTKKSFDFVEGELTHYDKVAAYPPPKNATLPAHYVVIVNNDFKLPGYRQDDDFYACVVITSHPKLQYCGKFIPIGPAPYGFKKAFDEDDAVLEQQTMFNDEERSSWGMRTWKEVSYVGIEEPHTIHRTCLGDTKRGKRSRLNVTSQKLLRKEIERWNKTGKV